MATFKYIALNSQGQTVDGQIAADGERQAQRLLRKRGLKLSSLSLPTEDVLRRKLKKKSAIADRILMLREMAVLIEAGVPLIEAVSSLAASRNHADLKNGLENVSRDLRQGVSLTQAMRNRMGFFPNYVHQLIESGEMTGQIKTALNDSLAQMEYDARISKEIRGALFYPAFLVTTSIAAVLFIFVVVVPRFAEMVKGRSENLPITSRFVLSFGLFVRDNLEILALAAAAIVFAVVMILRRDNVKSKLLDVSLKLPVIGAWLTETETARWTAMLATLLSNRIPMLKALELARGALNAPGLRTSLIQVERSVRSGVTLSAALDEFVRFPPAVVNLIRVGERAGNLSDMLRSAATMSDANVRNRVAEVLAVIEPAAVIFIGLFIGLIVVSIFTAITSINQIPL